MFVRGVVDVALLGGVVVLGPGVVGLRGRDQVGHVLGELDEGGDADGSVGLSEPGDDVGEDGFVGFGDAAFDHEGGVAGADGVDAGIGFAVCEGHGW